MAVTDINALRKWKKIPKDFRQRLLSNVFCITCFETTVVDYTLHDDEQGILKACYAEYITEQSLPKISNVFCITCFETTVVDYTLHDDEQSILITGKCKTCGEDVARLIEDA